MADYADIYGKRVKEFTDDPTLTSSYEGQVWYNENSGTLKSVVAIEAWSSGSPMIRTTSTAGANHALGAGIQTAAIYAGGYSPYTNKTEHYNGTGWTSGGNMNLTRITSGFGTETAAVAAGGITFPGVVGGQAEEYNGTAWTTGNALGTARAYGTGSGTLTAGLFFGGSPNASAATSVANSEEYNGTNWSEGNDLNTARRFIGSAATAPQTAALVFGGDNAPAPGTVRSFTETYDGTSWTEVGDLNTARRNMGGAGDFTSALAFGGSLGPPGNSTATESWDGSSWSTTPASLANARDSQPSIGTSTAALFVGGPNPSFPGGWVEEYNKSINTITAGAWASGGNMGTTRFQTSGLGSQTAALAFGGETPGGDTANTEEYNGSSWSEQNNLPATTKDQVGFGTQTAGVSCSGAPNTVTYKYDGSSWTSSGALNTGRTNAAGCGTQTAGVIFGGHPSVTATEEFNGSSWTTNPNAMPESKQNRFGTGTQTAALAAYGGPPFTNTTFEYDGSSWTSGGAGITPRADARGGGTQTDAIAGGGYNPGYITSAEGYDGTAWSTRPSLSQSHTGGCSGQGAAPASANWISGGNPATNATEEFTGETSVTTAKTLTTS